MTEQKGYHFVQILTRCRPALSRGYRYVSQQKFANLSEIQPIHISTSEEANWSTRDARHIQQHLEVLSLLWKPVSDCKADWSLKSPQHQKQRGFAAVLNIARRSQEKAQHETEKGAS